MQIEHNHRDQELFFQDLEEDKDMRAEINLYRDPGAARMAIDAKPRDVADGGEHQDEEDLSEAEVGLEELIDDLTLDEHEAFSDGSDRGERPPASRGATRFRMPGGDGASFHFT